MKRNATFLLLDVAMPLLTKAALPTNSVKRAVRQEYRAICARAKDIGANNPWISCYALGAWFIAMNRCNTLSPEDNYTILEQGLNECILYRLFLGSPDRFLRQNLRGKVERWTKSHASHPYENDWYRTLYPKATNCDLAFDFTQCGICKLCQEEGCFHLAHYLCKIDFSMAELMGLRLERTQTLADGAKCCDFRYHRR